MSDARLYKQAGNSVVVPVINRIAENIVKALKGWVYPRKKWYCEKNSVFWWGIGVRLYNFKR